MTERRKEPRHHPGYSPARPAIPHHIIHRQLWDKADARGRVRLVVGQFAEELGTDYESARCIVDRFIADQRIRVVHIGRYQVRTFEISNPDEYDRDDLPATRGVRWG